MRKSHRPQFEQSTIVLVAAEIESCFSDLDVRVPAIEIEKMSCFLNGVYGTRNRAFHDIYHALDVSDNCGPLGTLAGLFHDVAYLQVDRSRLPELRSNFGIFTPGDTLELIIPSQEKIALEPWANALLLVFGFKVDQKLGVFSGLNEFLSAWVAVQMLKPYLSQEQLIHIAACIESTIPFRGEMKNPTVSERLRLNILSALTHLNLTMSDDGIDEIVTESVKISNNDIKGFGMEEPGVFIHNSWALLYESNPALQSSYFSIVKYREPLQRLDGFLASLNPNKIFTQYKNVPNNLVMNSLVLGANANLKIGRDYVQAKLLDTAILEAFAMLSGGDCPLELFTGPKPKRRESKSARIEQFLDWTTITADYTGKDERVIRLLNDGRAFRSKFDVKTALFAAYIYLALSPDQFKESYAQSTRFFKREIEAAEFLAGLPNSLVLHIGEVICHVAQTRAKKIGEYLDQRRTEKGKAA